MLPHSEPHLLSPFFSPPFFPFLLTSSLPFSRLPFPSNPSHVVANNVHLTFPKLHHARRSDPRPASAHHSRTGIPTTARGSLPHQPSNPGHNRAHASLLLRSLHRHLPRRPHPPPSKPVLRDRLRHQRRAFHASLDLRRRAFPVLHHRHIRQGRLNKALGPLHRHLHRHFVRPSIRDPLRGSRYVHRPCSPRDADCLRRQG